MPANVIPRNLATGVPNYADDTGNTAGKRTNRGFEGLAVSPDGRYAYAMLQSAMLDEGGGNGTVNRIVQFDLDTGRAVAQFAYRMEGSSQGRGISALVALNETEFLVLERNNRGVGVGAEFSPANKRVYKIDMAGATDVSDIDLDSGAEYVPVAKNTTTFINLAADTLVALGNRCREMGRPGYRTATDRRELRHARGHRQRLQRDPERHAARNSTCTSTSLAPIRTPARSSARSTP